MVAMASDWHSETSSVMNNSGAMSKLNLHRMISDVSQQPQFLFPAHNTITDWQPGQKYVDMQTLSSYDNKQS